MAKTAPFQQHHRRYDEWFERHRPAYESELLAVRSLLPWKGLGLSIGVGTGRFAAPLGVQVGLDPSRAMLGYAKERGLAVVQGAAEALPFASGCFDYALSVTTICFVDDPQAMIREAHRVLRPGGVLVLGFIDSTSALGEHYRAHQSGNVFYREATFYSAGQVSELLENTGFNHAVWVQTLSRPLEEIVEVEPARAGYGRGAFVAVRACRE